ncbi:MAG: hypothetical protein ACPIEU_02320, partial [Candidatus Puniceispirillaceae bacterium]
ASLGLTATNSRAAVEEYRELVEQKRVRREKRTAKLQDQTVAIVDDGLAAPDETTPDETMQAQDGAGEITGSTDENSVVGTAIDNANQQE